MNRYDLFVDELGNIASIPTKNGLYANAEEAECRITKLTEENSKLRALVERGAFFGANEPAWIAESFGKDCREALK